MLHRSSLVHHHEHTVVANYCDAVLGRIVPWGAVAAVRSLMRNCRLVDALVRSCDGLVGWNRIDLRVLRL